MGAISRSLDYAPSRGQRWKGSLDGPPGVLEAAILGVGKKVIGLRRAADVLAPLRYLGKKT